MRQNLETRIATLIAKCWTDQKFRDRFLRDPKQVIAEVVLDIPSDVELVVVQDTPHKRHIVLPAAPAEGFSTEDVDDAALRLLGAEIALYCLSETGSLGAAAYREPASSGSALYCVGDELTSAESALYCVGERAAEVALYCCAPESEPAPRKSASRRPKAKRK